ncbi:FAD-dependent oxidoreductase [Prauserella alba]|uniref:FAD/NAD(P)-binding domain-containing protein n=1 Tax=Prauserella alba TaxID=176898 RepID=A0ABP4G0T0_9PSEU|nr:FAD-dependent oxidoreductase [Prauserella alba]MCP2182228.1 NADH dehydrogenase, FAD-containing subunit [Prauserella alba]
MSPGVVVAGGGYAGVAAAQALDDVADVVLVEPRDRFVHNVAALRALVDPAWTEAIFFPYDRLLSRGRVVRDRVTHADGDTVVLSSGERLNPEYLVLATGSSYPFPAKIAADDSADAVAGLRATRASLAAAKRVLLLGAGPVGLELAGEIKAAWPEKDVTLVDPAGEIVSGGYPDELRTELRGQLDDLGIELLIGTSLDGRPPTEPGELAAFTVRTHAGRDIDADLWFRCYGVTPHSDYLAGSLAAARRDNGHVEVSEDLRVAGHDRVFALGDLTDLPEAKMAKAAGEHAEVAAANIRALIAGHPGSATYQPAPAAISLPLGPAGGASYAAGVGVLGPERTSHLKGTHLRMDTYTTLFGLA